MTASTTIPPAESTCSVDETRLPLERVGDWEQSGQVSFGQRLSRMAALLRYHRPAQFAHRAAKLIRDRYRRLRPFSEDAYALQSVPLVRRNVGLKKLSERKLAQRSCATTADRFAASRFCFLNREVELSPPIDWRLASYSDLSYLWRFQFHYHEFLLDAAAAALDKNQPGQIDNVWRFVADWIDGNLLSDPAAHHDAWHPFCIARRLPVWVTLWTWRPPSSGRIADRILRSLGQQAWFLSDHLERDLGGNHLLEDLRALAVAGGFLEEPVSNRLLDCVNRNLPRELETQILEHGEHFERSPMYHVLMLDALLDVRDSTRTVNPALAERVGEAADQMGTFLCEMLDDNGEIPLLGDSVYGEAPPAQTLIREGRISPAPSPPAPLPRNETESGTKSIAGERGENRSKDRIGHADGARQVGPYWIWNDSRNRLVFDAGEVGADELPAHAHCDLLNIQMTVDGCPFVVDSGVFGYDDDAMRRYCRSTAAHNVLQVDGIDQCDVWSRFRMGRRGQPSPLQLGASNGFSWATAAHDAYGRVGVSVRRWIACRPAGPWIVVDAVTGGGFHQATSRLHFHPDVELALTDSGVEFHVEDVSGTIRSLGSGDVALKSGWYCERFGCREESRVLESAVNSQAPILFGWIVSFGDDEPDPELISTTDGRWLVQFTSEGHAHELPIAL